MNETRAEGLREAAQAMVDAWDNGDCAAQVVAVIRLGRILAVRPEPDYGDSTATRHRSDTLGPCLACQRRDAARPEPNDDEWLRGYQDGLRNARSEPRAEGLQRYWLCPATAFANAHMVPTDDGEWVRYDAATPPAPAPLDVERDLTDE